MSGNKKMKKEEILPEKVELVGDIEEISKQIGEELSKKVDDDNKFDVVRYFISNILVYSDLSPEETQNVLDSVNYPSLLEGASNDGRKVTVH